MEFPWKINNQNVPHIGSKIMGHLDTDDLLTAREVCSSWKQAVDSETTLWSDMSLEKAVRDDRIDIGQKIVESCKRKQDPSGVAPINVDSDTGRMMCNALNEAARLGRREFVSLIMENISNKNPEIKHPLHPGWTVLHTAAEHGHAEVCQLMLEQVEDKNPGDHTGYTPLHIAAREHRLEVCQVILNQAEDKNPVNLHGTTPLHLAALRGSAEICQLLLDHGANPDTADNHGETSLHYLAYCTKFGEGADYEESCKILIERMTTKNPPNAQGVTPLDRARECFWRDWRDRIAPLIEAKLEE